ncbi:protein of unknown function [Streptomyces murinus]
MPGAVRRRAAATDPADPMAPTKAPPRPTKGLSEGTNTR